MKFEKAVQIFVWGIFALSLLGVILGFQTDNLINFLLPFGVSFILSAFVGEWLESLTGDFFKEIYLSFPIKIKDYEFRVNMPLFIILVWIIKSLLFK